MKPPPEEAVLHVCEMANVSRESAIVALKWSSNSVQKAVAGIVGNNIPDLRRKIPWPVGTIIDAKDKEGDWYQASVIAHIGFDHIKVHYRGWGIRDDEKLDAFDGFRVREHEGEHIPVGPKIEQELKQERAKEEKQRAKEAAKKAGPKAKSAEAGGGPAGQKKKVAGGAAAAAAVSAANTKRKRGAGADDAAVVSKKKRAASSFKAPSEDEDDDDDDDAGDDDHAFFGTFKIF